jgi:hypothetical protein
MSRARARVLSVATAATLLLGALPLAFAHGESHDDAAKGAHGASQPIEQENAPTSYWRLSEHASLMYWHIALEVLAWIVVLPVGKLCAERPVCVVTHHL